MTNDSGFTTRPVIMGTRGVVTSGHYLATAAGFRIMEQGGNAVDAAAAMCFCVNLLEPQSCGVGGEVPTLIYSAKEKKAFAISGMGWSPAAFTIDWCRKNGIDLIPGDGYLPACVPAVVDTWALALKRFGTFTFSQVLAPSIELAGNGFPVYEGLHASIAAHAEHNRSHSSVQQEGRRAQTSPSHTASSHPPVACGLQQVLIGVGSSSPAKSPLNMASYSTRSRRSGSSSPQPANPP